MVNVKVQLKEPTLQKKEIQEQIKNLDNLVLQRITYKSKIKIKTTNK